MAVVEDITTPTIATNECSKVVSNLLKDAKKEYSKLWFSNHHTLIGLEKLKKHAEDRTIPTSMRISPFSMQSPKWDYDVFFNNATEPAPEIDTRKAYETQCKQTLEASLLEYQLQFVQMCINDKQYHVAKQVAILESYQNNIEAKWTRHLSETHQETAAPIARKLRTTFSIWQRDFHLERKDSIGAKKIKVQQRAERKAAAEAQLQEKHANLTPAEILQELLRAAKVNETKNMQQGNGKGISVQRSTGARKASAQKRKPPQSRGRGRGNLSIRGNRGRDCGKSQQTHSRGKSQQTHSQGRGRDNLTPRSNRGRGREKLLRRGRGRGNQGLGRGRGKQ
jgi:hypothetical protein